MKPDCRSLCCSGNANFESNGELMIAGPRSAVDIDDVHSAAICKAIGERLDRYYNSETSETPAELERLLARLRQLDERAEPTSAGSH
jgi:hypothetical protein